MFVSKIELGARRLDAAELVEIARAAEADPLQLFRKAEDDVDHAPQESSSRADDWPDEDSRRPSPNVEFAHRFGRSRFRSAILEADLPLEATNRRNDPEADKAAVRLKSAGGLARRLRRGLNRNSEGFELRCQHRSPG